jgi:hypothetical protein
MRAILWRASSAKSASDIKYHFHLVHYPLSSVQATRLSVSVSVPSTQVQGREIDIGIVGPPGAVQGTTAVSAKPPGVRISAAAATARWGSQLDHTRASRGLENPPRRGDYEVCHLPLLSGEVPSAPLLRDVRRDEGIMTAWREAPHAPNGTFLLLLGLY